MMHSTWCESGYKSIGVFPLECCDCSLHGCLYPTQVYHLPLLLWQGRPSSFLLGCNWNLPPFSQLKPRLPFLAYCLYGVCVHIRIFASGKDPSLHLVNQTSLLPLQHIFAISSILARIRARVSSPNWPEIIAVDVAHNFIWSRDEHECISTHSEASKRKLYSVLVWWRPSSVQ